MTEFDTELALNSNSWVFQEAKKLKQRAEGRKSDKGYVLFETGYGPSGLPHIGTFMEVFRTTLIRNAFARISDIPTKLFAVSDDMDGLRKVPDNIPNQEVVAEHLGLPLTKIPDPFGTHESYGAHMNAKLCSFLDRYGFDYEFKSATELYQSGVYDEKLLEALKQHQKILDIMLPTLGAERAATYSPFMPISPKTGHVLQVPISAYNVDEGTVSFTDEDGENTTVPVTGGHCKLQWKPDFGMRWAALGVDYEMYGKDHQVSGPLYSAICKAVGGTPPQQYVYEMFLDEKGEKISKSKGNGVSIEEWLRYGTEESLALYMVGNPRKARRLHFDVIPKAVDEYAQHLEKYDQLDMKAKLNSPLWHIHNGDVEAQAVPISYALLLNLAAACNTDDEKVLWGFVQKYAPDATPENVPKIAQLVRRALNYYEDFVKPNKNYRAATQAEAAAMKDLAQRLREITGEDSISEPALSSSHRAGKQAGAGDNQITAEELQTLVFSVGKDHHYENLREWFKTLYEVLLGQSEGPRMGQFISFYGIEATALLIEDALQGKLAA